MADEDIGPPDPGEPPHVDHNVDADRDLTDDPGRAEEPHRIADHEPPRLRPFADRDDDPMVAEEAAAAAREAGSLGGRHDERFDPAMGPVYEAGGGEAEGFEESEEELIDNAEHGDFAPDPYDQAFGAEVEADRSGATYGEADHEHSTELEGDRERDADSGG